MSDVLIQLPPSFRYVNQFASSQWAKDPSLLLCGESSAAMAAEIAFPGRWIPEELVAELCLKWTKQPDTRSDPWGTTKEEIMAWFHEVGIGYMDMTNLVNEFNQGNTTPLHTEIMAQNKNPGHGVPQIITVADEAYLFESGTRKPLHPWYRADDPNHTVASHIMLRVGFSPDEGYGWYMDPAAPPFSHPVKIDWADITKAGIMWFCAVMPHAVPQPPTGFLFQNGTWPVPPPAVNLDRASQAVHGLDVPLQALRNMADALDSNHLHTTADALIAAQKSILADIGKE